ncbi:MAG: 16S rRNA (guanine(527)-N(7))-methyltransferase RsmG [Flavitalea sp.]
MEKAENKLELITKYFSDFTPVQLEQLRMLEEVYLDWNTRINVISRKDTEGLYEKHVLHSLSIAALCEFQKGQQVLDLGTGGGFPGIPLAIFFPDTEFLLVDSIAKKLKVVDAVAEAIGLKNVATRHTRAEEIKSQKFDTVVSRAVAPLGDLWKWSKPLLRKNKDLSPETVNGLICLKGGDLAQEISDSECRPRLIPISELFTEEYFKEKYVLVVRV